MLNFKILIPLTVLAMSMFSATATGIPSQTCTETSPARPTLRLIRHAEVPIPANRHAPAPVRLARRVALDPTNLPGGFSVGDAVYATEAYNGQDPSTNIARNEVGVVQGPSTDGDQAYLSVLFSGHWEKAEQDSNYEFQEMQQGELDRESNPPGMDSLQAKVMKEMATGNPDGFMTIGATRYKWVGTKRWNVRPSDISSNALPGGLEVGDTIYACATHCERNTENSVGFGEEGVVVGPAASGDASRVNVVFSENSTGAKRWNNMKHNEQISKTKPTQTFYKNVGPNATVRCRQSMDIDDKVSGNYDTLVRAGGTVNVSNVVGDWLQLTRQNFNNGHRRWVPAVVDGEVWFTPTHNLYTNVRQNVRYRRSMDIDDQVPGNDNLVPAGGTVNVSNVVGDWLRLTNGYWVPAVVDGEVWFNITPRKGPNRIIYYADANRNVFWWSLSRLTWRPTEQSYQVIETWAAATEEDLQSTGFETWAAATEFLEGTWAAPTVATALTAQFRTQLMQAEAKRVEAEAKRRETERVEAERLERVRRSPPTPPSPAPRPCGSPCCTSGQIHSSPGWD